MKPIVLLLLALAAGSSAHSASFYSQRLDDPRAFYIAPSTNGDDTAALQQVLDRVQETNGQGLVLLAPGEYHITNTVYIWPGIRLIGCGATRPRIILPARTAGYDDVSREKVMFFFAGRRPGFGRNRFRTASQEDRTTVPDANPGTFYSALANMDIEVADGNPGAVGVRAHYAQHCFLAHMDFHLGPALAGIHEGGNVVEDVHFFGGTHAICTSKPSPGWQFTLVDCSFEDQREASILEHEAGLTLIRPRFARVPTAVAIEPDWADELWVKDARLEHITGPAFIFGLEKNPRTEINMEGIVCRDVPVFASLRERGKHFAAPGAVYAVKTFTHGLEYADAGDVGKIESVFNVRVLRAMPAAVETDVPRLPACADWVNVREFGARGDGSGNDTAALQKAIETHRALYFPSGFYIVHDTLKLRGDTVLIGMHPGATQIILPDGEPGFQGIGGPKALIQAPAGGSNIVIGLGLYASGNNRRAVAALWKAGARSMMNDVRFLGGHGTPLPDGSRENPYNSNHSADPNPVRHWDSQYPSLWVTEGGGGTFLDIWTPSTFAQAGMLVSDTQTEGRAYQISSEHHVRNEVILRNAAHWRFYALQTEEERGESGFALPLEIENCQDITFANFHAYRVISSFQPFPWAANVSNSRDVHFRNVHCDSNSKVSFDSAIYDQNQGIEIRQREFASLDISGQASRSRPAAASPVLARGAHVEKLAGNFFNISGGAAATNGDFCFVDAHWNRIYRWTCPARQLSIVTDAPMDAVNLSVDDAGDLMFVSYAANAAVFALNNRGEPTVLKSENVLERIGKTFWLPVSDWNMNRNSLSNPAAQFISPDGGTVLPVGDDFIRGTTSWGVKSSPQIRSFGLGRAVPGQPFFISEEAALRTWAADVNRDGSLRNFRLFAEQGGEGVAVDSRGNVFIAAGQIYVYDPSGKWIDTIEVPERPVQLVFGGPDHRTLFIAARTSLYSVRTRFPGR